MRTNLISDKLRNQQHCSRIKNEKTDTDDYLLTFIWSEISTGTRRTEVKWS